MKLKPFLVFLLILLNSWPLLGRAEFYKYKDHQGKPYFTNNKSRIPPEYRNDVEIIQEKSLPPLHQIPDPPLSRNQTEKTRIHLINHTSIFSIIFILFAVLMFLALILKGFKGSVYRLGLKFLVMAFISIAIAMIFFVQGGIFPLQKNEISDSDPSIFSPIQKVQKEVKQIEKNLKKQEELLNSVNPEN